MYRKMILQSLDVDWFVVINDIPIHIASNGGYIPQETYRVDDLKRIYAEVLLLKESFKEDVDSSYIKGLSGYEYMESEGYKSLLKGKRDPVQEKIALYSETFAEMARRGFYSFDRIDRISESGEELYRLIAWPLNSRKTLPNCCFGAEIPLVQWIEDLLKNNRVKNVKESRSLNSVMDKIIHLFSDEFEAILDSIS